MDQIGLADCPPNDADALPLKAYRVVSECPPISSDFMSWVEEGKKGPPGRECECRGISLFLDLRDAKHHIALFGMKSHIAEGEIPATSGKAKKTATNNFPSHITWWPNNGVKREQFFKCMDV